MNDKKPLHDYRNFRAILIGTSNYTHLPTVSAASNSLDRMSRVLTSDLCGWPRDRITIISNERGPGDLPDKLITLFEEARDVALFYFVGHGQIDVEDQLCLGLVGSRTEPHRRASTSLQSHSVRQAMLGSPAKTKIIILDCCYAGLANKLTNTLGAADLLDKTSGTGAYTMAACSAYASAWFEESKKYPQTYFTKYMADIVEAGITDEPSALRLRVLFGRLRENLAYDSRPLPEDRNIDSASDFVFAYNAAPPLPRDGDPSTAHAITTETELGNVRAILTNLSQRNQVLVEQQIELIDLLEKKELDDGRLKDLYRLDHIATRMRRHSENLRVLAGFEPLRLWSQPVPLRDVARAAASEIEQFQRVELTVQPDAQLVGQAVNDVIHLIAELLENATIFSPRETQVYLTAASLVSGSVLVEITDSGPGMPEQEIARANWLLENPPGLNVAASRRMGLFVVSHLAARHGIRVRLRQAQPGGLTALIWLPDSILLGSQIAFSLL